MLHNWNIVASRYADSDLEYKYAPGKVAYGRQKAEMFTQMAKKSLLTVCDCRVQAAS